MFFFFFSSRRRHTRSLRDWSSDVCSSDLERSQRHVVYTSGLAVVLGIGLLAIIRSAARTRELARLKSDFVSTRSEEHTSELQSRRDLVCRLLLEKKKI